MESLNQKLNAPLSVKGRIALVIIVMALLYPAWRVGAYIAERLDNAVSAALK